MALCFVTHSRGSAVLLPRAVEFGNIGIDMIDASNNPLGHKLSRQTVHNAKATLANLRFVSLQKISSILQSQLRFAK